MVSSKPKITRKTVLFPIVGLIAFFLYIYLFNVDVLEIISTAQRANPVFYAAAILFSLIEVFLFAVSWRTLLSFLSIRLSLVKSYLFVWYGIFVDIVIPAESISGEVCRVYLVNREHEGCSGKVVASLFMHRLLGMGLNVVFLIAGAGLLFGETSINGLVFNLILFATFAVTVILFFLILLSFRENWSMRVINGVIRLGEFLTRGRWKLASLRQEALDAAKMFHIGMKEFKQSPKTLGTSLFFLLLNWLFSMSVTYLVFLSLGFSVPWSVILVTGAIVVAVKSIPVGVPFEVGLPEITMTTLYVGLGVPPAISATATILSRLITLWLRFFIGFGAQQWLELKPKITPPKNST